MKTRGKDASWAIVARFGIGLACWLVGFGLWSAPAARAGLIVSGTGWIQLETRPIVGNSGTGAPPIFSSGGTFPGQLLSPGNTYPVLGNPTPVFFGTGPIAPQPLSGDISANNAFGTARTLLSAQVAPTGATGVKGGAFFSPVAVSNLVSLGAANTVSVSVAHSDVTILNTLGSTRVTGRPGDAISVNGSLSGTTPGEFVAAALTGTYNVARADGGVGPSGTFNPIVIAFSGPGSRPNFIEELNPDLTVKRMLNVNSSGLSFSAALSTVVDSITLNGGDSIHITGTLTLLADPGSITVIDFPLDQGFDVPDFGNFVAPNLTPVPELSAVLLCGQGVGAAVVYFGWRRVRKKHLSPAD